MHFFTFTELDDYIFKLFAPQSFILDPELLMNYVNNESIYCHCKDYVKVLNQNRKTTLKA